MGDAPTLHALTGRDNNGATEGRLGLADGTVVWRCDHDHGESFNDAFECAKAELERRKADRAPHHHEELLERARTGPPQCDELHNGFEKCGGPEAGCYSLAGSYEEDARYNYPAREEWWRSLVSDLSEVLASVQAENEMHQRARAHLAELAAKKERRAEKAEAELASVQAERDRYEELLRAATGRDVEAAVIGQIEAIRDAMKAGDAPEALKNLSAGMATTAAFAVANARWATREHELGAAATRREEALRAFAEDVAALDLNAIHHQRSFVLQSLKAKAEAALATTPEPPPAPERTPAVFQCDCGYASERPLSFREAEEVKDAHSGRGHNWTLTWSPAPPSSSREDDAR